MWNLEKIKEIFSEFVLIKSVSLKDEEAKIEPKNLNEYNKESIERLIRKGKYAFVCFEDPNDKNTGFLSASKSVEEYLIRFTRNQSLTCFY